MPFYVEFMNELPANTCTLSQYKSYRYLCLGVDSNPEDNGEYETSLSYDTWLPNYSSIITNGYVTKSEFLNMGLNTLFNRVVGEYTIGTLVPAEHWPEMLTAEGHIAGTTLKRFSQGGPESPYPQFGYYPPKHELADGGITDPNYDGKFYRYIGQTHLYYTTSKAAELYLPVGTDPAILNLEPLNSLETPKYLPTNSFGYDYAGTEETTDKVIKLDLVTSDDFTAYPKDGVAEDGYYYEYLGTNENLGFY